jgi:hypothetical protein
MASKQLSQLLAVESMAQAQPPPPHLHRRPADRPAARRSAVHGLQTAGEAAVPALVARMVEQVRSDTS